MAIGSLESFGKFHHFIRGILIKLCLFKYNLDGYNWLVVVPQHVAQKPKTGTVVCSRFALNTFYDYMFHNIKAYDPQIKSSKIYFCQIETSNSPKNVGIGTLAVLIHSYFCQGIFVGSLDPMPGRWSALDPLRVSMQHTV